LFLQALASNGVCLAELMSGFEQGELRHWTMIEWLQVEKIQFS